MELLYAPAPDKAEEQLDESIPPHIYHARHGGAVLDARQHGVDPGVVPELVEAAERETKDEVTDDIKRRPVEPGLHVERLALPAAVLEPDHQLVHVLHDQRLLGTYGRVAEAVAQRPP